MRVVERVAGLAARRPAIEPLPNGGKACAVGARSYCKNRENISFVIMGFQMANA
jgi:hypothetical protein